MTEDNQLTPREIEVLKQLGEGHTYMQTARSPRISEETVRKHATDLYTKLDVKNRTQAIKKYFK
ncbi:MAG: helix-turn-helix transcriptional regulator [Chitinophagales bacterium]|jgi:DNA-binding CsgD family transcriptional regulator|nr:helix-turn-helix transcriptional regulator [Chitinophagales bacterium]